MDIRLLILIGNSATKSKAPVGLGVIKISLGMQNEDKPLNNITKPWVALDRPLRGDTSLLRKKNTLIQELNTY